MNNKARVRNVTRGFSMKFGQAVKAVELCACAWVEYGVSVRSLTSAESLMARNAQVKPGPALAPLEVSGTVYRPALHALVSARVEVRLAREVNAAAKGRFVFLDWRPAEFEARAAKFAASHG